jgi:hypothetical protein
MDYNTSNTGLWFTTKFMKLCNSLETQRRDLWTLKFIDSLMRQARDWLGDVVTKHTKIMD